MICRGESHGGKSGLARRIQPVVRLDDDKASVVRGANGANTVICPRGHDTRDVSAVTALVLDLIRAFGPGNGIIGRDDVVLEILVGNQTAGVYDGDGNGRLPPLADSLV